MTQLTKERQERLLNPIRKTLATMRRMEHDDNKAHAYVRDVTKLLTLLDSDSQAAGSATPTTPLLQKIVEITDIGSAQEFGDAVERLRAIRGLIIGENV